MGEEFPKRKHWGPRLLAEIIKKTLFQVFYLIFWRERKNNNLRKNGFVKIEGGGVYLSGQGLVFIY